ncbi:hypothetical protein FGIG_10317 [Fasciola gigantica]|uniref:Ig-like domain-containing protein n=1 Tax=Fasciola gigantica TaxID=46835 RepID=A0A504YPA3_FASGI|nr:hypothetical protein FGIG_10317 [Fasciola gigantica]
MDFCREIGRGGHYSKPESLAKLISTPEIHNVHYSDFNRTIFYAPEFEDVELTVLHWDNKQTNFGVFTYNKPDKHSWATDVRAKQYSRYGSSGEENIKHFTETVQLHYRFEGHIYKTSFRIRIDRTTEALSVILNEYVEPIHNLVRNWLNQEQEYFNPKYVEAAFRVVRVASTRRAIYKTGDNLVFPFNSEALELDGLIECFVQHGDERFERTERMELSKTNRKVTMNNLQVSDSGLYTCERGGRPIVGKVYVIVLPRLQDVAIYINRLVLEPQDPQKSNVEQDELGRPFLRLDEKMVVNCVYYLSKGLDNFRGMKFEQSGGSKITWKLLRESRTDKPNYMFMWIHSYASDQMYVKGRVIIYHVACAHDYQPDQYIVRHNGSLDGYQTKLTQKAEVVVSLFPPPVIIPWGISTNHPEVTDALLNGETTNPNLGSFSMTPERKSKEGILSGSFYSMHYRVGGWTRAWILLNVNNQIEEDKCSLLSTVLKPEEHKSLFDRSEIQKHYGAFILTNNTFSCCIPLNAIGFLITAFNTERIGIEPVELEQVYIRSLKEVVKERLKSSDSGAMNSVTPHENSAVSHRLVRIQVGWQATVYRGSQIEMFWDARSTTNQQPRCEYQMDHSQKWSPLSNEFKVQKLDNIPFYKLYKSTAALTDSGRYKCFGLEEQTMVNPVRTLAVIPKSEDIEIEVDYEKIVKGSNGSLLILSGQEMTARCSIEFSKGFQAKFSHSFSYETLNQLSGTYLQLKTKFLTEMRLTRDQLYGFERKYFTIAPAPGDYLNETIIFYNISLSKRTRDAYDLMSEDEIVVLSSSLRIPIKGRLHPKVLSQLTKSDQDNLEKELRAQMSANTETALLDANRAPVSFLESSVKLQFTIFAGIPKGKAKLWLTYQQAERTNLEECVPVNVKDLASFSKELRVTDVYKKVAGTNFQQLNFHCIFLNQHTGLILAIFNAYDHTVSIEEEENVFKHKLKEQLLKVKSVQSGGDVSDLSKKVKTEPIRVSVRLKVGWKAILRIGDKMLLLGRYSKRLEGAVTCVKRTSEDDRTVGQEVTSVHKMSDEVKGFTLVKQPVKYSDSGVYECKDNDCKDCKFESGLTPRNVHILPNDEMLSVMLNHKTLTSSGPFEANFDQCFRGRHPYLFTEQSASVRCASPKSEFALMKPTVNLIYQMFDTTLHKLVNLKSAKEAESQTTIDGKSYYITGFTIQAPTPDELKGDLRLTCQFVYDKIRPIGNDMSGFTLPVVMEKKRDLGAKLLLSPRIFDEFIVSDKPKLLDNHLHRDTHSPLSAEIFHKSGSKNALMEDNVRISVLHGLGVPRGHSFAFTVYESEGLHKDDCFLNEAIRLTASNTPMIVKEHSSYRKSKGANYENATFTCTVQPEHIALVLVVFNVFNENELEVKKSLVNSILDNVKLWLKKPSSTEAKQLQTNVNTRADWRVQRLSIGWHGSVALNTRWKMLVAHQWFTQRGGRLQRFRFICYYQTEITSKKEERFNEFTDSLVYFEPEQPARLSDSGIYHCVYMPCTGQCDAHILAAHRRLLVLPNQDALQLYINLNKLNMDEPLKTEWNEYTEQRAPIVRVAEQVFVYCQFQHVPGMASKEKFSFSVTMQNPTLTDRSRSLTFQKQSEPKDNTTFYTAGFVVDGPKAGQFYDPVTIRCRVDYDDSIFDQKDLRKKKMIEPLVKASSVTFAELILPNIYNTEIKASNEELEYSLQHAKNNIESKADYLHSTTKSTLNEGIFKISTLVSLGVPRGEVLVQLMFEINSKMTSDLCIITSNKNVASDQLPVSVKNRLTKKELGTESFAHLIPPGSPGSSECELLVSAQEGKFQFDFESIGTETKNNQRLYSYRLTAPKMMEFKGLVKLVCRWTYTVGNINPPDVAGILDPILIESVKLIEVRAFAHPAVYPKYTISTDENIQMKLRDLEKPIQSPSDFHSRKSGTRILENVHQINLIASLGYPRGSLTMWTMFSQREHEMISEPCRLNNLQNLNNQTLPEELKDPNAHHNIVNASFHCVLKPEHTVLSYVVHNSPGAEANTKAVEESILSELKSVAFICSSRPNNVNQLDWKIPFGSFANYGLTKLDIGWFASQNTGSNVSMLGFGGTQAEDQVICYYQYDETHWPPFQIAHDIKFTRIENSFGFRLDKEHIEFSDSGIYSCNVSATCHKCPPTIGFVPRKLTVLPSSSILRIYVNQDLFNSVEAVKDNYKRCTLEDIPCILAAESIFVHCVYSQPRGVKFVPKLTFTTKMIDIQNNETENLSGTFLRKKILEQRHGSLVIHSYRVIAPKSPDVFGPLECSCSLLFENIKLARSDMKTDIPVINLNKSRRIHIDVRLKPVIFEKHTVANRGDMQHSLRDQTANSVTNAFVFHKTALKSSILEGWFSATYFVHLGIPKGIAKAYLLYQSNAFIQPDNCIVNYEERNQTALPEEISQSDFYTEARGANFYRINVRCAISPRQITFIFFALNSFDFQTSVAFVERSFLKSVYRTIENWLRNPADTTDTPFETTPSSSVTYQMVRLRVGWRGSLVEGEPIVLFGVLGSEDDGKPMCFRQKTMEAEKKEIDTGDGKFMILLNRELSSFELIKSAAELPDAGFYFCLVLDCETCTSQKQNTARQLLVFSKNIDMKISVSHVPFEQNDLCRDAFTQVDSESTYVYTGQKVVFHCIYELPSPASSSPLVEFLLTEQKPNTISHISHPFGKSIVREITSDNVIHNCTSYIMTIPLELHDASQLFMHCKFSSNYQPSNIDVNRLVHHTTFSLSRPIKHKRPRAPKIDQSSVQTNYVELTRILKHGYIRSANHIMFRMNTNMKRIPEGLLNGSFLVDVGSPVGESKVWTLFWNNSDLIGDPCQMNTTRAEPNADFISIEFICPVQPHNVALLLYALNTLDYQTSCKPLSTTILPIVINSVRQWISDNISQTDNSDRVLKTPAQLVGDYYLVRIRVGWNSVVRVGDSVSMFGRFESNSQQNVQCYHRYTVNDEQIKVKLLIDTSKDKGIFWTHKSQIHYTDSGLYECKILDCDSVPRCVGVPERQLIVLPSSSILRIRMHSQLDVRLSGQQCRMGKDAPVKPGDKLTVSCLYPIALGLPIKLRHSILHGNAKTGTERTVSNLVVTVVKQGTHEELNVSGVVQMPQSIGGLQLWNVSCQLAYDAYNVSDGLVETVFGSTVKVTKRLQLFIPNEPKLLWRSIETDQKSMTGTLKSADATCANRDSFLRTDTGSRLEEGLLNVAFVVDRGAPEGWPLIWLIYRKDEALFSDPCLSVRQQRISRLPQEYGSAVDAMNVSATCILQPEHVALFIGVVNIPGTDLNKTSVETELESSVTSDVANWLQGEESNRSHLANTRCFNLDFRMMRLHVGWRASVNLGSPVIMQGRLRGSRREEIKCYYRKNTDDKFQLISRPFILTENVLLDHVSLKISKSEYMDTGIYHCNATARSTVITSTVIGTRKLLVLPAQTSVKCSLTLDEEGNTFVSDRQRQTDGIPYLLSNHTAFAHCDRDPVLESIYHPKPKFHYGMTNAKTKTMQDLTSTELGQRRTSTRRTFQIVAVEARYYTGMLRITCSSAFTKLSESLDVVKRNDSMVVECYNEVKRDVRILETRGSRIILSVTHAATSAVEPINNRLIEALNPINFTSILPNFSGGESCETCHPQWDDPALRIKRGAIFNMICQAVGNVIESRPRLIATTAQVVLDPQNTDNTVFCIQRQGDPEPQLLDAVNYAWAQLTVIEPVVRGVRIVVKHWPNMTTKAALFQCQAVGFIPGMEIMLLFKPGLQAGRNRPEVYHVIGRERIKFTAIGNSKLVSFPWLEISSGMDEAQFLCLLWPWERSKQNLKFLTTLPSSTRIFVSGPVTNLLIIPNCPTAPKIRFKPDLDRGSYQNKTRLDMVCEGTATANALPFKLYYLASTFSIILCSHHSVGNQSFHDTLETEVPCSFASHRDVHCDQLIASDAQNQIYYPNRCTYTYRNDVNNLFRRIELTVTMLRERDFGARVFCEVIDSYSARSTSDESTIDLRSDVRTVVFSMPTQIVHFFFKPDDEMWTCKAAAFPFPQVGMIEVVRTSSVWLQKQLDYYESVLNFTQPQILHSFLLPKRKLINLNYTITVSFVPSFMIPGGLREGQIKLRCSMGDVQRELNTVIANRSEPVEPITRVPSVPGVGKSMHFTCAFSLLSPELSSVVLLRQIRSAWLTFDISVSSVLLLQEQSRRYKRIPDRQLRMKGMGLWRPGSLGSTVIMTANESNKNAISLTISKSKEFDAGVYYCTSFTINKTFSLTPPFKQLVLGKDKQTAFAMRKLSDPRNMWLKESASVQLGEPLLFRCIFWTTNPSNRRMTEFSIRSESGPVVGNRTTYASPHRSSIIIQMIDERIKPHEIGQLEERKCAFVDQFGLSQKQIRRIEVKCEKPTLTWEPKDKQSYLSSDILTCHLMSGCENAEIRWSWVAGPIPQLTFERDRFPVNRVGQNGSKLVLSMLPRGGNYQFRCTVSCYCANQPLSSAIQVGILVGPDSATDDLLAAEEAFHIQEQLKSMEASERTSDFGMASRSDLISGDNIADLTLTDEQKRSVEAKSWEEMVMQDESVDKLVDPLVREVWTKIASENKQKRDLKQLGPYSTESWMDVEQIENNIDSLGQNQYMDQVHKRRATFEDLTLEQSTVEKENQIGFIGTLSPRIYDGLKQDRRRTKTTRQDTGWSSDETLLGETVESISSRIPDHDVYGVADQGVGKSGDRRMLGPGIDSSSHPIRRQKDLPGVILRPQGTFGTPSSIDALRHRAGQLSPVNLFGERGSGEDEGLTPREQALTESRIPSSMRMQQMYGQSSRQRFGSSRDSSEFTIGAFIPEELQNLLADHDLRDPSRRRRRVPFAGRVFLSQNLNRKQWHRLNFPIIANDQMTDRLAELKRGRISLAIDQPGSDIIRRRVGEVSDILDSDQLADEHSTRVYRSVPADGRKMSSETSAQQRKSQISRIGTRKPGQAGSEPDEMDLSSPIEMFSKSSGEAGMWPTNLADSAKLGRISRRKPYSDARQSVLDGSERDGIDLPSSTDMFSTSSGDTESFPSTLITRGQSAAIFPSKYSAIREGYSGLMQDYSADHSLSTRGKSKTRGIESLTFRDLNDNGVESPFDLIDIRQLGKLVPHGGRRGPPSSQTDRMKEYESQTIVGRGYLPSNFFTRSGADTVVDNKDPYEMASKLTTSARTDPVSQPMTATHYSEFQRFHVPRTALEHEPDFFDRSIEHRIGTRAKSHHAGGDVKPTAQQHPYDSSYLDSIYRDKPLELWKQLGYPSETGYLRSLEGVSRMMDGASRTEIELEGLLTTVKTPWWYDGRSKAFRFSHARRTSGLSDKQSKMDEISARVALSLRATVPLSEYNAIQYNVNQFTPQSTRFTPTDMKLNTMHEYWPVDHMEIGMGSAPVTWNNYLSSVRVRQTETSQPSEKATKVQSIRSVVVEPNPARIPGIVTVRCPSTVSSHATDYRPVAVTWIRMPSADKYQKGNHEEIIHFSLQSRMVKTISTRDRMGTRSYIYPPQKWSDSHTLDIVGLVPGDYGFYACVTTFSSQIDSDLNLNITKQSEFPLCVLSANEPPILILTRNSTGERNETCHPPNTAILIECRATAYRVICEKADQDAFGMRLIDTILTAHIHAPISRGKAYTTEITNEIIKMNPLELPDDSAASEYKLIKRWSLTVKEEYDRAYLTCHVKPKVNRIPPSGVSYIKWLHNQFNEIRSSRFSLRSGASQICVSSKAQGIRIDPKPVKKMKNGSIGILEVHTNQVVTCTIYDTIEEQPEFIIYPILPGKSKEAQSLGLMGMDSWLNKADYPLQWRHYSEKRRTRVFIPSRGFNSTEHLMICNSKSGTLNEVSCRLLMLRYVKVPIFVVLIWLKRR